MINLLGLSRNRKVDLYRARARRELKRRVIARRSFLEFIRYVWWKPWEFLVGPHTKAICARIDKAIDDYFKGKSTYLSIAVPYRHGKSDIISRALPAYFLARCIERGMDPDVIMSGYGGKLVKSFSRDAMAIIRSAKYRRLFPGIAISLTVRGAAEWQIRGKTGLVKAAGLGGDIMGRGGDLCLLDDYCKNREDAFSQAYRKKTWLGFEDFFSRRAPVTIMIVVATPWHVDDVRGRIRKKMKEDPNWPRFEELNFPGKIKDKKGNWTGKYLFEERLTQQWYKIAYAFEGRFSSAVLECEPVMEGGNRFKMKEKVNFHIHDTLQNFPGAKRSRRGVWTMRGYSRGWDMASSTKERNSDDPDWTVGTLARVITDSATIKGHTFYKHQIWIADLKYCRAEAPERDEMIIKAAIDDGNAVTQCIEGVGGFKDAYTTLKKTLLGVCSVVISKLTGDKAAKHSILEQSFENGDVHILRAEWNNIWRKHFTEAPDGDHEDCCDSLAVTFDDQTHERAGLALPSGY